MFIGHYSVALAAKRFEPGRSLGWTFLAVQFLDVLWAPAILLGIEKGRVVPGFLPASPLNLYYMPWTHSLAMAVVWSWLVYRIFRSPVMGACVFSHWILDLVTHQPDLPILRDGLKLGMGLWRYRDISFVVEVALLLLGLLAYLRATRAIRPGGRYAMAVYAAVLIAVEAVNIYGPPPANISTVAVVAEVCYLVFAAVAHWLDRFRTVPATTEI